MPTIIPNDRHHASVLARALLDAAGPDRRSEVRTVSGGRLGVAFDVPDDVAAAVLGVQVGDASPPLAAPDAAVRIDDLQSTEPVGAAGATMAGDVAVWEPAPAAGTAGEAPVPAAAAADTAAAAADSPAAPPAAGSTTGIAGKAARAGAAGTGRSAVPRRGRR